MSDKIIQITSLTKKYKELTAVNNLTLSVNRGDVFGFLGPNGAGKSTTIRMLLSLIFPTSGEISIFGKPLNKHREEILRNIGAIVEKPDLYGYLSAYKNLEILARTSGIDVTKSKIMETLELVGLEKRYKSKVKTFSHGMKQRMGLAQALIHDPELIVLDEPTTGLDPQGMKEIRDLIHYLSTEKGKTIVLSSHILYEVELVCNSMVIINKGKTVVEGSVQDLLNAKDLKVKVETDNGELASQSIRESGFAGSIEDVIGNTLLLNLPQSGIAPINKLLVEKGIAVSSIVPTRSLEEYFLQLTEGGE